MNSIKTYWVRSKERNAEQYVGSVSFTQAGSESDLETGYEDPYVTTEQKRRDAEITRLLQAYVSAYESKVKQSKWCRSLILISCMCIIVGLAAVLGFVACRMLSDTPKPEDAIVLNEEGSAPIADETGEEGDDLASDVSEEEVVSPNHDALPAEDTSLAFDDLIAFITVCISFVTLIISLLAIITRYFFPENDEQYITKIVEAIQNNDFKNKQENARQQPTQPTPVAGSSSVQPDSTGSAPSPSLVPVGRNKVRKVHIFRHDRKKTN